MLLRFVKNNLTAKPLRNILVVISCTVSILLMLMMVNISSQITAQFNVSTEKYNYVLGGNCSDTDLVLDGLFFYDMPTKRLDINYLDEVKAIDGVGAAVPIAMADNVTGTTYRVIGTTDEFFVNASGVNYALAEGNYLGTAENFEHGANVVLGANVAKKLGLSLGSTFTASHSADAEGEHAGFVYTVTGILKATGNSLDNAAYTDYKAVWAAHEHVGEEGAEEEEEGEDNHAENGFIHLILIAASPSGMNNLQAAYDGNQQVTLASTINTLNNVFSLFGDASKIVLAIIIIVIIMAFNMLFLAMFTAAGERRRDVAILRAIGSDRGKILLTILLEALIIMTVSCLLGWLLSFAGLALTGGIFTGMMGIVIKPTAMCIEELYIVLGSFGIGILATLIPALMVYKTEPSKYLR